MGSPGAPNLAICLCSYFEHQFRSSITDFIRHLKPEFRAMRAEFCRYVDDLFGLVTWDARFPFSRTVALTLVDHLRTRAYHPNMIIKDEPSDGWFPYLDALVRCPDAGPLEVRFHVKNYSPLCDTGSLKLLTIQHRSSFMSDRTAMSRILGTLHRLRACVREPAHRLRGAYELLVVYEAQGYTPRLFQNALSALARKFNEPFWFAVDRLIRLARLP